MEYIKLFVFCVLIVALLNIVGGEKYILFNRLRGLIKDARKKKNKIKRDFMHSSNPYYLPEAPKPDYKD